MKKIHPVVGTFHPAVGRVPPFSLVHENVSSHQSVQDMINAYLPLDQPQNEMQLTQLIENVLATVTYATRASVSRALNTSPGNLVFNRDMFVDVPLISNLAAIRDRRQQLIDENLIRENKKTTRVPISSRTRSIIEEC